MERFGISTRIYAGAGAVNALASFGGKRVFVVTDPYFYKNGTAARIGEASGAEAVKYFADVKPDPSVELAAAGTAKLKAFGADLVVALGGGSENMLVNTIKILMVPTLLNFAYLNPLQLIQYLTFPSKLTLVIMQ